MKPFDPKLAIAGTIMGGVDASTLFAGREPLIQWRIALQHELIASKTPRWDMIKVSCEGVIISGNHGVRAAAEAGVPVDVFVIDFPQPSCGPILSVSVIPR
jgi:hypothetical protein